MWLSNKEFKRFFEKLTQSYSLSFKVNDKFCKVYNLADVLVVESENAHIKSYIPFDLIDKVYIGSYSFTLRIGGDTIEFYLYKLFDVNEFLEEKDIKFEKQTFYGTKIN